MGQQIEKRTHGVDERQRFRRQLLSDLQALERMIENGDLESEAVRVGIEQEVALVDGGWQPAPIAGELFDELDPEHFTAELALFNFEIRLGPLDRSPTFLSDLERRLISSLVQLQAAADRCGARVVLTGILPTLSRAQLTTDKLTPWPRFEALRDAMRQLGGSDVELAIRGRDELLVGHDRLLLEACNTSFQFHCQVPASEFAARYNLAQLVTAPVLAAAGNSPILFGKQLWRESRIALFGRANDTRAFSGHPREQLPRVCFGSRWVDESVVEIYREDIVRFPILLGEEQAEDALAELDSGRVPELVALHQHNGTVYRWNRPCYGLVDGQPTLRIENRALPSGPSVVDEIANGAFWLGLLTAGLERYGDLRDTMSFAEVRGNFFAAARYGLDAHFGWPGAEGVGARKLILGELLPLAREGLEELGVVEDDRRRYLGVVEERARTGRTGAWWLCDGDDRLRGTGGTIAERAATLVKGTFEYQSSGRPVHEWGPLDPVQPTKHPEHYVRVGQLMSRDLFTVLEDELIDLAASVMTWRHIRHVPVEDANRRLVGLLSHRALLRMVARGDTAGPRPIAVKEVMTGDVVSVTPDTPTLEAIELMRRRRVSCLPVVDSDRHLVGILSERDLMGIAGHLLEGFLSSAGATPYGSPAVEEAGTLDRPGAERT